MDERVKREETEVEKASRLDVWDTEELEGEGDLGNGIGVDEGAMTRVSDVALTWGSSMRPRPERVGLREGQSSSNESVKEWRRRYRNGRVIR